jgi:hypothetical protein
MLSLVKPCQRPDMPPPAGHTNLLLLMCPVVTCPAATVLQIYVLIRGKRGTTAKDRLAQLLQKGLFHLVRDNPRLLAKVSCCCCCRPAAADFAAARAVVAAGEVPQLELPVDSMLRQTQRSEG